MCVCVCVPFAVDLYELLHFVYHLLRGMFVIVAVPVTLLRCASIGIYAEVCEQGKPEFKRAIQRKAGTFSF